MMEFLLQYFWILIGAVILITILFKTIELIQSEKTRLRNSRYAVEKLAFDLTSWNYLQNHGFRD
jgi:hypothetical protein